MPPPYDSKDVGYRSLPGSSLISHHDFIKLTSPRDIIQIKNQYILPISKKSFTAEGKGDRVTNEHARQDKSDVGQ